MFQSLKRDKGHSRSRRLLIFLACFNPSSGIKAIHAATLLGKKSITSTLDCQDFAHLSAAFSLFVIFLSSFHHPPLRCERLHSGSKVASTYGRKGKKSGFFSIYGSERLRPFRPPRAARKPFPANLESPRHASTARSGSLKGPPYHRPRSIVHRPSAARSRKIRESGNDHTVGGAPGTPHAPDGSG
jgi:hypothetical protein